MKQVWLYAIAAVGLTSCLKDELPVPAHAHGAAQQGEACVGSSYEDQVWYDLGTNSIVRTNSKMDWDLAFESAVDGWHVRLNTARFMRANPTGQSDITQPTDTTGYAAEWRIDRPSGAVDSTAIGDWRLGHGVYALDMGYNTLGLPIGLRKLRVITMDASSFTFEMAALNGTGVQQCTVQKDPARRYVHFSLLHQPAQQVDIAPPDGDYDLVFTQFTTQFYDPYIAYLVTGAVDGFSGARVAAWHATDVNTVALGDTLTHPLSAAEDAIGYDWKTYDFDNAVYTIDPSNVYIVQDAHGYYFKLHFTDFYNEQGQRGCPQFELTPL